MGGLEAFLESLMGRWDRYDRWDSLAPAVSPMRDPLRCGYGTR